MFSVKTESSERISERIASNLITSCSQDAGALEFLYSILNPILKNYFVIIPKKLDY